MGELVLFHPVDTRINERYAHCRTGNTSPPGYNGRSRARYNRRGNMRFSLFRLTESFLSSEVSGENSRATTSELSGRTESTFNTGRGIGETRFFFDLQEESNNKSAANRYIIFFIFSNIRSAKIDKKAKIYVFALSLFSQKRMIEKENGRSET